MEKSVCPVGIEDGYFNNEEDTNPRALHVGIYGNGFGVKGNRANMERNASSSNDRLVKLISVRDAAALCGVSQGF